MSGCVLIVEPDVLVRHPLAEYLRECGYQVIEAVNAEEARVLLTSMQAPVDAVLADADAPGESGFAFAAWVRETHPGVDVILAGSVARTVDKASDLCQDGPALTKPYDHRHVLDRIRRMRAARTRSTASGTG